MQYCNPNWSFRSQKLIKMFQNSHFLSKITVANRGSPSGWGFSLSCQLHRIRNSLHFFFEKNCLFILTTIFSVKITIKNYCTEDGYSTERGFCGHSRIRVLNSRKIRAILRYFKIFCQFCRKSTCLLLHNFPLISNLAPFRPKFQFSTEIARWNWVNSKLKSVQFWPNFVLYPEMQNLDIFGRNRHFRSENSIFAIK